MSHPSTIKKIAEVAQEQWGLITRRQALDLGISPATIARLIRDNSILEQLDRGVYHLTGAPLPDHVQLRAAWLQLAPDLPIWERDAQQGVVSHRSAAALFQLGDLPADRHEFTLPTRRQSRRPYVRLHHRTMYDHEWTKLKGIPLTRPARIVSDLLYDHEDPGAVGQIIADAIRNGYEVPGEFVQALSPHAFRFGLQRSNGLALLHWLLDLIEDPDTSSWMAAARSHSSQQKSGPQHRNNRPLPPTRSKP